MSFFITVSGSGVGFLFSLLYLSTFKSIGISALGFPERLRSCSLFRICDPIPVLIQGRNVYLPGDDNRDSDGDSGGDDAADDDDDALLLLLKLLLPLAQI